MQSELYLEDILQLSKIPLMCSICKQEGESCIMPCRFASDYTCEHMCDTCLHKFLNIYPNLFKYIRSREITSNIKYYNR